jgi:hypothetical protein
MMGGSSKFQAPSTRETLMTKQQHLMINRFSFLNRFKQAISDVVSGRSVPSPRGEDRGEESRAAAKLENFWRLNFVISLELGGWSLEF